MEMVRDTKTQFLGREILDERDEGEGSMATRPIVKHVRLLAQTRGPQIAKHAARAGPTLFHSLAGKAPHQVWISQQWPLTLEPLSTYTLRRPPLFQRDVAGRALKLIWHVISLSVTTLTCQISILFHPKQD